MWLIPSFISAFCVALQSVYLKKNSFHFNAFIVTWAILAISSILYIPLLLSSTIPHLNNTFWIAVIARLFIDSIGLVFFVKGLKQAPLSMVAPMVSLVPLILLLISFFINHLFPTPLGILGIFITLFGVYYLNFDHDTKHVLSPFKSILRSKGMKYIIIFVISQAFVTSLAKLAIDNSNTYFYTSFFQLFWAICFTPITFLVNPKEFMQVFSKKNIMRLFPVGGLDAIQVFAQNIGYTLTLPVYVQSVQNTSILFASIFGALFFKEKIGRHLIPTVIIILGITVIAFAQK